MSSIEPLNGLFQPSRSGLRPIYKFPSELRILWSSAVVPFTTPLIYIFAFVPSNVKTVKVHSPGGTVPVSEETVIVENIVV